MELEAAKEEEEEEEEGKVDGDAYRVAVVELGWIEVEKDEEAPNDSSRV